MRNEDYFEMEFEDALKEQAYLKSEKEQRYWEEEQSLLRREAKISILNKDLIVLDHDRVEIDTLAF